MSLSLELAYEMETGAETILLVLFTSMNFANTQKFVSQVESNFNFVCVMLPSF